MPTDIDPANPLHPTDNSYEAGIKDGKAGRYGRSESAVRTAASTEEDSDSYQEGYWDGYWDTHVDTSPADPQAALMELRSDRLGDE
jgi:hypothetical protein